MDKKVYGALAGLIEETMQGAGAIKGEKGDPGAPGKDGLPGEDGVGISSIEKTSTNGLVDTYTITFDDGRTTTFNVTNGKDGAGGSGGSTVTYYYKPVVVATSAGKYWKRDGTLGDSTEETDTSIKKVSATNLDQYLPVVEGEVYRITTGSVGGIPTTFNVSQCLFLNDSDEFIANAFSSSSWHDKEIITVPQGATKMHITVWSGTSFKIEKQTMEPYGVINKFEILNYLNKIQNEEQKITGRTYAQFDKGYVTFVNDDCRTVVSEIVDVFHNKGVKLCLAAIANHFNNLATTGTVLDAVKKCVQNGGEVLSHAGSPITDDTIDDFDTLYAQFAKSKEMLELYGFDVNGIILAGGTGQITGDNRTDKWARAYYQYSDLYGNESYGYPYYHYRTALSNFTLEKAKEKVDNAIANKEWLVFYLHEWSEFSQNDMESLLDYVNSKNAHELEAVTYKEVYDKFCIKTQKRLKLITAEKSLKSFEVGTNVTTDDITVTYYYDDGTFGSDTSNITVDVSEINTDVAGIYYMKVTYENTETYIPIEIYSSGERTLLYSGKEGNIAWGLYSDGVMELENTVSWKQNLPTYEDGSQPWYGQMALIKKVKIKAGQIGQIGSYAFYGATNLSEVDFTGSDTDVVINGYAFGYTNVTKITNAGIVSTSAFNGSQITTLTLGCTQLNNNAFEGCTALTEVRLTNSTMKIDGSAFYGVKNILKDLYVNWLEGDIDGAPWGATGATIHYNTTV